MNVETEIHLNKFQPRPYQLPIIQAIEEKGYKKLLIVMPRRSGKDLVIWNIMCREALRKVGIYLYCLPIFKQCRDVIWENMTSAGVKLLDALPKEVIKRINNSSMTIELTNGSMIKMAGSDNYDTSIVGNNFRMIVFSEYALADPRAYTLAALPIVKENGGTLIFLSTPRGKNHLFELFQIAQHSPDWFCYKLTLDDTQHISVQEINKEIASGEISEDLAKQEYYTSFELGQEGAIYAKYLNKMRLAGRIGEVPYESSYKVNTAWDIGRDTTSIIFFQCVGQIVRLIDYYEKAGENLEFFVRYLESKPYLYNKHFFPHDMAVTEWAGPKFTRVEKARQLGLKATIVDDVGLEDGIEHVRCSFDKLWIDEKKCAQLIKCIDNYRRELDANKRVYGTKPLHNWASHGADALRYMCLSLSKTQLGTTPEELDRRYREAMAGDSLPGVFSGEFDNKYGF